AGVTQRSLPHAGVTGRHVEVSGLNPELFQGCVRRVVRRCHGSGPDHPPLADRVPLPTLRRLMARYTTPSTSSTAARPPAALTQCPSRNMIFLASDPRAEREQGG